MSENYKIGSYEISTKAYYDALNDLGITNENMLKKLDVNGDKKLTEDELMSLEIQDENIQSANTQNSTNQNTMTTDERIAQVEKNYEERLLGY